MAIRGNIFSLVYVRQSSLDWEKLCFRNASNVGTSPDKHFGTWHLKLRFVTKPYTIHSYILLTVSVLILQPTFNRTASVAKVYASSWCAGGLCSNPWGTSMSQLGQHRRQILPVNKIIRETEKKSAPCPSKSFRNSLFFKGGSTFVMLSYLLTDFN